MKKIALVFAALLVLLVAAGCGYNYNFAGTGNSFVLRATLDRVGHRSVTVKHYTVVSQHGKAEGWFDNKGDDGNGHQIHDNYDTCSWSHNLKTVGTEWAHGHQVSLRDLEPGMRVTIYGRIRQSEDSCGKSHQVNWRPVFDKLVVGPRG